MTLSSITPESAQDMLAKLGTPTSEPTADGGMEVTFNPKEQQPTAKTTETLEFNDNLALALSDETLEELDSVIGQDLVDKVKADLESREEWEMGVTKAMDLLGIKISDGGALVKGGCTASSSLIIENVVRNESRLIQELFPPAGPVKTQIVGAKTDDKEAKARRIADFMNWQVTEQIPNYFEETERLLSYVGFAGVGITKIYYDQITQRPARYFLRGDQFVISNHATDLETAERYAEIIPMNETDWKIAVAAGVYVDRDIGEPSVPEPSYFQAKNDKLMGVNQSLANSPMYYFYEVHCFLDDETILALEGPEANIERPLPYVVTVHMETGKIVGIRRLWKQDDKLYTKLIPYVKWTHVPSFGWYSWGYAHLLGNTALAATTAMRSIADAGQFANMQGGFVDKSVKLAQEESPLGFGEWRQVEVGGGKKLSDAMMPVQYKEPSAGLMNFLTFLVNGGQQFADTTQQVVSDSAGYGPVGTTMALLDASAKFHSSIHKRAHKSLRDELKLLKRINRDNLPKVYPYDVAGGNRQIYAADFDNDVAIIPVSDPNIATQAQRAAMAQMVYTNASQQPQVHNVKAAARKVYELMGVQDVDKIVPPDPTPQPADPMTDIMMASRGMPIAAFPGQDHQAHIAVKSAFLQDPLTGANPVMAQIQPMIQANVREHMIMDFQEKTMGLMQAAMSQGVAQDPQTQSRVLAEAAKQVMQVHQAMVDGPQVDPLAEKQLELKGLETILKAVKLGDDRQRNAAELAVRNRELDLREQDNQISATEAGLRVVTELTKTEADNNSKLAAESVKAIVAATKAADDNATKRYTADRAAQRAAASKAKKPKSS